MNILYEWFAILLKEKKIKKSESHLRKLEKKLNDDISDERMTTGASIRSTTTTISRWNENNANVIKAQANDEVNYNVKKPEVLADPEHETLDVNWQINSWVPFKRLGKKQHSFGHCSRQVRWEMTSPACYVNDFNSYQCQHWEEFSAAAKASH